MERGSTGICVHCGCAIHVIRAPGLGLIWVHNGLSEELECDLPPRFATPRED